jgi:hypothetical protein
VSDDMVEQVRRFDRVATQRAGALNDRFLATRAACEARMVWKMHLSGAADRDLEPASLLPLLPLPKEIE